MTLDKDSIGKAMTCAAVSGGVTALNWGTATPVTIPMLGRQVPLWSAAAFGSGLASVGADMVHESIFPAWEKAMVSENTNQAITSAAAAGMLNAGVLYAYDPTILRDFGMWQAVAMGGAAEYVGGMLYRDVLKPALA